MTTQMTNTAQAMPFTNILAQLKTDPLNAVLYAQLGDLYAQFNPNLAYLCYENAAYLAPTDNGELVNQILSKLAIYKASEVSNVRNVSIIILNYNNVNDTIKCIDSIKYNCCMPAVEIIVVDNGSTDYSVEILQHIDGIKLVLAGSNLGFAGGCNLGIGSAADDSDVFLLNNDAQVFQNSLFTLRMGLYADEKNGCAGCVSNHADSHQQVEFPTGSGFDEFAAYALSYNLPSLDTCVEVPMLTGNGLLISRKALSDVGVFDVGFPYKGLEDYDLSLRMLQGGYRNVVCRNSFIFHEGRKTVIKARLENPASYKENENHFIDKWKFLPEGYASSDRVLCDIVNAYNTQGQTGLSSDSSNADTLDSTRALRVFEIGAGLGANLMQILHDDTDVTVHGVENTPGICRALEGTSYINAYPGQSYDQIFTSTYNFQDYDIIILNRIFEKTNDMPTVLQTLKNYMADDCHILVLFENASYAGNIASLIDNNFEYKPDKSFHSSDHIRLCTYGNVSQILTQNSYQIQSITGITGSDTLPDNVNELIRNSDEVQRQMLTSKEILLDCILLR